MACPFKAISPQTFPPFFSEETPFPFLMSLPPYLERAFLIEETPRPPKNSFFLGLRTVAFQREGFFFCSDPPPCWTRQYKYYFSSEASLGLAHQRDTLFFLGQAPFSLLLLFFPPLPRLGMSSCGQRLLILFFYPVWFLPRVKFPRCSSPEFCFFDGVFFRTHLF